MPQKKNTIFKGSEYFKQYQRTKRNNKHNLKYFTKWNRGIILSKDIDESKIFNSCDWFYIKKMSIIGQS